MNYGENDSFILHRIAPPNPKDLYPNANMSNGAFVPMPVTPTNTFENCNCENGSRSIVGIEKYLNRINNKRLENSGIKAFMDEFGYTEEQTKLINKAIMALNMNCAYLSCDSCKRITYTYGTLAALCINYDSKRWRMTTGQPTRDSAIYNLKDSGLTEQEVVDLCVLINMQHGAKKEDIAASGISLEDSNFGNETKMIMQNRATGNNDFAHSLVQVAAFAHGDDMYKNKKIYPSRLAVDYFNSPKESCFTSTMTRYEISFKGDIDSGRWSEDDFNSDIDAINVYQRMLKNGNISLDAWTDYYKDISCDNKKRAVEFLENMGNGEADVGIINTRKIIEEETGGSAYIQSGASKSIEESKSTFMQWIISEYQGAGYEFPD